MPFDQIARIIIFLLGLVAFIGQLVFTIKNHHYMPGGQFMRSAAFSALLFAALWGVAESMAMSIPPGPRTVILFWAIVLSVIAVCLPKKYQQFSDDEQRAKRKSR